MLRSFSLFLSTFFYIGKIKYAPGTFASLCLICLWYFLVPYDYLTRLGLIFFLFLLSIICVYYSLSFFEEEDPQSIVIDEVLGMSIGLFFIKENFLLIFFAFILFRFFDILKPSIIYYSQNLKQPYGILIDDVLAGAFTALIILPYTW